MMPGAYPGGTYAVSVSVNCTNTFDEFVVIVAVNPDA
jgi:hypothetical protein